MAPLTNRIVVDVAVGPSTYSRMTSVVVTVPLIMQTTITSHQNTFIAGVSLSKAYKRVL